MTYTSARDRGSASVELVLMTPVLVALLLFVVAAGRLAASRGEVDAAARDAARAASIERSATSAETAGIAAASTTLADRGVTCRQLDVTIDTGNFRTDGLVRATVACTVDLEALAGIGLPASKTLIATFSAPLDRYRGLDP
jgi:Flp pilus assembly protein TadG